MDFVANQKIKNKNEKRGRKEEDAKVLQMQKCFLRIT
jgi:hypothetical protein